MKTTFRFSLLILVLLALTFTFLYVTRETEEELRAEINELNSQLRPHLETISELDAQLAKLYVKVESISEARGGHVTRQNMLEIMDLNVESYRLIEERQRAECQKIVYENALQEKRKKIESLKRTFFVKTFLR
jgi:chromosome segregation ATPase